MVLLKQTIKSTSKATPALKERSVKTQEVEREKNTKEMLGVADFVHLGSRTPELDSN